MLDARLALSPYLVGETYTIADMAAYSWIDWADRNQLVLGDEPAWTRWPHLRRWFLEIAKRPAVQRARGAGQDLPLKTTFDDVRNAGHARSPRIRMTSVRGRGPGATVAFRAPADIAAIGLTVASARGDKSASVATLRE